MKSEVNYQLRNNKISVRPELVEGSNERKEIFFANHRRYGSTGSPRTTSVISAYPELVEGHKWL